MGELQKGFAPMVSRDNAADVLGNCGGELYRGKGVGKGGRRWRRQGKGCDLYRWHVTRQLEIIVSPPYRGSSSLYVWHHLPHHFLVGDVTYRFVGSDFTHATSPRIFGSSCTFGHSTLYIFGDYGTFTSVCACISPLNVTVWR